ncbi:MAG: YggS family pyridoxal phosphate-dependent enzyme [Flavobacteriales bacterium]
MFSQARYEAIKAQLPPQVTLVAVSKTYPAEVLQQAYDAGVRIFGENRVQELLPKYEALPKDIEWHLIGHLQSNKVKYIVPFVHMIHSVDSLRLFNEIQKQASKAGRIIQVLLQMHIASEETKFGFDEAELLSILESGVMQNAPSVKVRGLMGMASFTEDTEKVKTEFAGLKKTFDAIKAKNYFPEKDFDVLSMGMSGDYLLAVEQGSTMVRIGSALFGARN